MSDTALVFDPLRISKLQVLYDFDGSEIDDGLSISQGEVATIIQYYDEWLWVSYKGAVSILIGVDGSRKDLSPFRMWKCRYATQG